jgi:hypothetical protein
VNNNYDDGKIDNKMTVQLTCCTINDGAEQNGNHSEAQKTREIALHFLSRSIIISKRKRGDYDYG